MEKVAFLGGGSFGTALATVIANKGYNVNFWLRNEKIAQEINQNRTNEKYLKGVKIPTNVKATCDLKEALTDVKYIVLTIPSSSIRNVCEQIREYINDDSVIISLAKGIEDGTNLRLSEVIEQVLDKKPVVLSGPSHAEEVAALIPTTIVSSSKDMKLAEEVQELFMTPTLRIYTNEDLIGVEVGGAVKNIIAVAAGILDGIGYGDNTKAALMTRGMKEISRVGIKLGGKEETFYGLTGMGDLIVTCTSMHSRNRKAGILFGKGKKLDEVLKEVGMVVEGVKACHAFYTLKESLGVSMPITDVLYKFIFEEKDPIKAIEELMQRDKKSESY
ncbi:NAD(P)H-dependent glycerol-3-phosphate dehydrogenase [Clostridium sp. YIM B02551]|uniref:NAD(P)H-dependent glycerol-3-phosphate dehydrogenase n=1 Tax=Clostridium sp. YIM B02551 TaxID=2910679 RepID=UPI001EEC4549|nr:NAD(P)H-dependent glycerol-3-phosphate dehydrogenase [Clostridium sp. YIM B02551]